MRINKTLLFFRCGCNRKQRHRAVDPDWPETCSKLTNRVTHKKEKPNSQYRKITANERSYVKVNNMICKSGRSATNR